MLIRFELTRREHDQALAAVADSQSRERPTPWFYIILPLGILQGIALGVAGAVVGASPQSLMFNSLIPSMALILAGMSGLTAIQIRTGRRLSWRMILALSALFLIVAELFLLRGLFLPPAASGGSQSTGVYLVSMLLPHITWITAAIGLAIGMAWSRGRRMRLEWEGNPSLHIVKTADITANVVEISDANSRCQYTWASFVKFEKTKDLFLLYLSPSRPLVIPKRSFNGPDEINALCAMAEMIAPSRGHGFPVGPAGSSFDPQSATPLSNTKIG